MLLPKKSIKMSLLGHLHCITDTLRWGSSFYDIFAFSQQPIN
jgi:hypothetical protein